MNSPEPSNRGTTRFPFRVLAGILAAFLLLVGLPLALLEAGSGGGWSWLGAFCCLYGGVGMAVGARTGRWFGARG